MSSDDPIDDSPESFADLESSKAQFETEFDFLLSQPIDPAILEKANRKREELEHLSQKAVSELSGDEALRLTRGKELDYAEAPQLFELWWKSVEPATQKEINIAAEDFAGLTDYQWRYLTLSGGSVMNATRETLGIKTLYAQFQENMSKITEEIFTSKWSDAAHGRKITRRGRERSAVKCFIHDYMDEVRQVLHGTFLIAANRPTSEQQRDRQLSKFSYEGLTPREIAQQWNRDKRRSKRSVTPAGVSKAIEGFRCRWE